MTMTACPFLKGSLNGQKSAASDCILEKCPVWNLEHRECWIITSLKGLGGSSSSFKIPTRFDEPAVQDIPVVFPGMSAEDSREAA
jgi:hypothetical protein